MERRLNVITLGVNGTTDQAFLALVDDDTVLDVQPYALRLAQGLTAGGPLLALRNETAKLLQVNAVDQVRILDVEATYRPPYVALILRLTIESVIAFAAAELWINCARRTRASMRSVFDFPKTGALSGHVKAVIARVGQAWPNKRDLAALVALAGNRES
jgi:hypothetical protein